MTHSHPTLHDREKNACGICHKEVKETDKAIECDKCLTWIHIKCQKMTVKKYKFFQDNPEEKFECKNCNKCKVCCKVVATNHKAIECTICHSWVHIGCNKLDKKDYAKYQTDEDMQFYCIHCLSDTLPLLNLDNKQFDLTAQGINYPENLDINEIFLNHKQVNMIEEINRAIDRGFDTNEDSDNEICPINCKYYTINEINDQKFNSIKQFSIMHLNIHSLEFHIEELKIVLKLLNFSFDFICITESKIRKNCNPKYDVNLDGYQPPVGTPTEAAKGGVMIYAKVGLDFIPREDLNIYKPRELESYFIEVINAKGKNTIIGTIYRHPCMDQSEFIDDFMQPLNDKLLGESKKTFIGGDFNFDFLNTENNETFNFLAP